MFCLFGIVGVFCLVFCLVFGGVGIIILFYLFCYFIRFTPSH